MLTANEALALMKKTASAATLCMEYINAAIQDAASAGKGQIYVYVPTLMRSLGVYSKNVNAQDLTEKLMFEFYKLGYYIALEDNTYKTCFSITWYSEGGE